MEAEGTTEEGDSLALRDHCTMHHVGIRQMFSQHQEVKLESVG